MLLGRFHLAHLPGHGGFVLLVLFVVHGEFVAHVIGFFVFPILARVGVGQLRRLPLQELLVSGIGQGRVGNFGSAVVAALNQVAGAKAVFANGRDVFITLD